MPKDPAEVQDQYKIRGGSLNEYEITLAKGDLEESREGEAPHGGEGLRGADEPNAPQNVAERIRAVEARAHEIVEERRRRAGGGGAASKKSATKGGAGKKSSKGAAGSKKAAGQAGGARHVLE